MGALRKPVVRVGGDSLARTFIGRDAWALGDLISAGERGCTPIDQQAPRKLRRGGVPVETIEERHAGPYARSHARYVLAAPVLEARE